MDALKVHLKKTLATAGFFLLVITIYLPVLLLAIFGILVDLLNILAEFFDRFYWRIYRRPRIEWYFKPGWWLSERSYFG